jgi:transglutaminase-like putative cysteine protease
MKRQSSILSLFLFVLGFLLLLEWVWPIEQLSGTADIWVFQVFLTVALLLSLLRAPLFIRVFLKGILIVYFLHFLYFEGSFFQTDWLLPFLDELRFNIEYFLSIDWTEFTDSFRSLLFFILLWMLDYLLHYWFIHRKQIMTFIFITFLFITVLDTFTPYNASDAVVRTVVISFFIMGILTVQRLSDKENIEIVRSTYLKWIISLSSMVILSVALGFALPKSNPIWPDPVPHIQRMNEVSKSSEMGSEKRVGYGVDDSNLGGSIAGDPTVVFQTEVESPHYWKVETKDVYTGKGWVTSNSREPIPFTEDLEVPITSFMNENTMEKKVETSKVHQIKEYPHVLYPFGVKTIQSGRGNSYELDPIIEKIYSFEGSKPVALADYSVTYEIPKYRVEALQSTENVSDSGLSMKFISRYTQLPETLPRRVNDLALEITRGEKTWYDKAKAIETYFKEPQFSYSTENVMVPDGDVDYVDQFLFDSLRGYCDNFSTSMVVLLRSLDIPARWVKGYTEGESRGYKDGDSSIRLFDVTNNNAHSWVEVYFPQVGWVSFEPTPGFTNGVSDQFVEEELENRAPSVQVKEPELPEQNNVSSGPQSSTKEVKGPFSITKWWDLDGFFRDKSGWVLLILLVVFGLVYYIYRSRSYWLPGYFIWKFKRLHEDESFEKAYIVLLKQYDRMGMKRQKNQTLGEYARFIDQYFSTEQMTKLTNQYEKYIYGNQLEKGTWNQVRELWENLIKQH